MSYILCPAVRNILNNFKQFLQVVHHESHHLSLGHDIPWCETGHPGSVFPIVEHGGSEYLGDIVHRHLVLFLHPGHPVEVLHQELDAGLVGRRQFVEDSVELLYLGGSLRYVTMSLQHLGDSIRGKDALRDLPEVTLQ